MYSSFSLTLPDAIVENYVPTYICLVHFLNPKGLSQREQNTNQSKNFFFKVNTRVEDEKIPNKN